MSPQSSTFSGPISTLTPPETPIKLTGKKAKQRTTTEFPVDASFITSNQYGTYLKAYGIVVCVDGSWYELRCYVCGANTRPSSIRSNHFIGGMLGMKRHLSECHDVKAEGASGGDGRALLPNDEIIRLCSVRKLSASDIRALSHGLSGAVTIEPIGCNSTDEDLPKELKDTPKVVKLEGTVDGLPTVAKFSDGTMIEMRCALCGSNCYGGRRLRFYKGIQGFNSHLQTTHRQYHQALESPELTRNEWTVRMCSYKKLSQDEVLSIILSGSGGYKGTHTNSGYLVEYLLLTAI
jgi:hypothetical protein